MSKKWTVTEKTLLYRLVESEGNNWAEYSPLFGVSPNAVRKCYNNTDWREFLKSFGLKDKLSIDDLKDQIVRGEDVEEQITLEVQETKEKILERSRQRRQKEVLDKIATESVVLDKLTSAIVALPPIKPREITYPKGIKFETRPQEAVLCLSDIHIGLAVIPEEVGGLGNYSVDVFKKRLDSLVEKIAKITEHHRKCS